MNSKISMKTLVKYVPGRTMLSVRSAEYADGFMARADRLVAAGIGDNTVQEDGKTVYVARDPFKRLRF